MTRLEVFIRPHDLEKVQALLSHTWVSGHTVSEVKGCGRQRGHLEHYRGAEYRVDLVPKLKVELVVPTPLVPRLLHDLQRTLRTGRIGDGKVLASPVDEAIRVRTGERGEEAL
jgi:nitrogen regulatory protein P-II 1